MTGSAPEHIDVLSLPKGQRHATIRARFDALKPGEGLVLSVDHDPQPLLRRFQADLPNGFEWWPLEQGPTRWRIHLAKHDGDPDRPRTITNVMCADHQRLDRIYGALYKALERGELAEAQALLRDFQVGIRRHILAEEDILMPLMADRGGPKGPADSQQMHDEHERILEALARAQQALVEAAPTAATRDAQAALTEMRFILEGHNQNEERLLYPISDRETREAERADLIRRIQAL